jgi:hypothetical protein
MRIMSSLTRESITEKIRRIAKVCRFLVPTALGLRLQRERSSRPDDTIGDYRATPLLWLSVLKDELKDQRNSFESLCLARLARCCPRANGSGRSELRQPQAVRFSRHVEIR